MKVFLSSVTAVILVATIVLSVCSGFSNKAMEQESTTPSYISQTSEIDKSQEESSPTPAAIALTLDGSLPSVPGSYTLTVRLEEDRFIDNIEESPSGITIDYGWGTSIAHKLNRVSDTKLEISFDADLKDNNLFVSRTFEIGFGYISIDSTLIVGGVPAYCSLKQGNRLRKINL